MLERLGLRPFNLTRFFELLLLMLLPCVALLEVVTYTYGETIATFSLKLYLLGACTILALFYAYWLQLRKEKKQLA